jgi:hypothetical protein
MSARQRGSKSYKDVEKTVYLTSELLDQATPLMFQKDISFSELVRLALRKFIDDELSQQKQENSRDKLPANCGSSSGLYTAEQVAQLIDALTKK